MARGRRTNADLGLRLFLEHDLETGVRQLLNDTLRNRFGFLRFDRAHSMILPTIMDNRSD